MVHGANACQLHEEGVASALTKNDKLFTAHRREAVARCHISQCLINEALAVKVFIPVPSEDHKKSTHKIQIGVFLGRRT